MSVAHYDFTDVGRTFDAWDRDLLDQFLPNAFEGGIGNRKLNEAIGWCKNVPDLTPAAFRKPRSCRLV